MSTWDRESSLLWMPTENQFNLPIQEINDWADLNQRKPTLCYFNGNRTIQIIARITIILQKTKTSVYKKLISWLKIENFVTSYHFNKLWIWDHFVYNALDVKLLLLLLLLWTVGNWMTWFWLEWKEGWNSQEIRWSIPRQEIRHW